jgi:hypothetical protein
MEPIDIDHRFRGRIINPDWMPGWAVIDVAGSKELLGTGNSSRVEATLDGIPLSSALMPTGQGNHFISVSAALRKKLGKSVGDEVEVHIVRRLT